MLSIGHHFRQATGILVSHLSGPTLLGKLTHEEGDLLD
jgi:hypothetical protein